MAKRGVVNPDQMKQKKLKVSNDGALSATIADSSSFSSLVASHERARPSKPDNDDDEDEEDEARHRELREQQEQQDADFARRLAQSEGTSLVALQSHERRFAAASKSQPQQESRAGGGATSPASLPSHGPPRQRTVSARSETETISLLDDDDDDDVQEADMVKRDDDEDDNDLIVTGFVASVPPRHTTKPRPSVSPDKASMRYPAPLFSRIGNGIRVIGDTKPVGSMPSFFSSPPAASTSKLKVGEVPASPSARYGALLPLDTSIFAFSPTQHVDTSAWPSGRMPYAYLASAFVLISSTRSRLFISRVLTNLFRVAIELDPDSLMSVVYLCSNRIGPAHERDLELGVGPQVLSKAFKEVSGLTPQALRQLNKLGDPGDVAFEMKKSVRLLVPPPPLVCHSLFSTLHSITRLKGAGSLDRKSAIVKRLLVSAQGEEARYLVRTLVGNLRIGAVRLTIITALAKAFSLSRAAGDLPKQNEYHITEGERQEVVDELEGKQGTGKMKEKVKGDKERMLDERLDRAEAVVRRVWARHPDYGHVVAALLDGGISRLEERVPLAVGTPLEPMLGSITRGLHEIYTRLGSRPFVSEAKLDGQRGQIHVSTTEPVGLSDNSRGRWYDPPEGTDDQTRIWVRCFSRHLEDMSDKYPDIAPTLATLVHRELQRGTPLDNFILDCEIVAIDPNTSEFKTFQELSYRSKKDVQMGDIKVRVGIFGFDLMYLNGESLLGRPFRQRRALLYEHFSPLRPSDPRYAKWELVPSCLDNDIVKVKEFFGEALKMRAEGIMVKLLDDAEIDDEPTVQVDLRIADDEEGEEEAEEALSELDVDSSRSPSPSPPNKSVSTASPLKSKGRRRKLLPATYEPDKRADSWLKVKKDYLDDQIGDSLDLIPIGAWHGNGRKAKWWSPILLGVYDPESGQIQCVCKCMSGFTDAFYESLNAKYAPGGDWTSVTKPPEIEAAGLRPSIWFKPNEVWEMRGADFTLSPVYPAAQHLLGERGVSVRFPRFIRVREDKSIEQATTTEQLADMYRRQGDVPERSHKLDAELEED